MCGETAILAPQLRKILVDLNKVDPNTATTGLEEQFKVYIFYCLIIQSLLFIYSPIYLFFVSCCLFTNPLSVVCPLL